MGCRPAGTARSQRAVFRCAQGVPRSNGDPVGAPWTWLPKRWPIDGLARTRRPEARPAIAPTAPIYRRCLPLQRSLFAERAVYL